MNRNKTICNICGKEFDFWDVYEDISFHKTIGYGSAYDGDQIDLDVCCRCFDKLIDETIIPMCKINPVTECGKRN